MTIEEKMTIEEIAYANDASIIADRDGDIAIMRRHYDGDGIQQPRYAPDPVDYLPKAQWEEMTPDEAARHVC